MLIVYLYFFRIETFIYPDFSEFPQYFEMMNYAVLFLLGIAIGSVISLKKFFRMKKEGRVVIVDGKIYYEQGMFIDEEPHIIHYMLIIAGILSIALIPSNIIQWIASYISVAIGVALIVKAEIH